MVSGKDVYNTVVRVVTSEKFRGVGTGPDLDNDWLRLPSPLVINLTKGLNAPKGSRCPNGPLSYAAGVWSISDFLSYMLTPFVTRILTEIVSFFVANLVMIPPLSENFCVIP